MKSKMLIFWASLMVLKFALASIFISQVEFDSLFSKREAIASESRKDPEWMTKEDRNITGKENLDLSFLIKKTAELKKAEEKLEKDRTELTAIQEEINNKIAILTQLRNEIKSELDNNKTFEDQNFKHVVKAYLAMKPQKAASLVEKLDLRFAVKLLSKMKGDTVGNILSFVDIEKAAEISERLAKLH